MHIRIKARLPSIILDREVTPEQVKQFVRIAHHAYPPPALAWVGTTLQHKVEGPIVALHEPSIQLMEELKAINSL